MRQVQAMDQEKGVLRWGGLAGILGSIAFVIVFVIVFGFVGDDPAGLAEWVERFPGIRTARTMENGLYLLVFVLWVPHFLSLYHALKGSNLAAALFGAGLAILGLAMFSAGALPHVATIPLSDLYHAPGATPADQATLALMWQATWGVFDALLVAGFAIVPFGLLGLGIAMLGAPSFGKGLGAMTVVFGVVGVVVGVVGLINPDSPTAAASMLSLIIFNLVLGMKLYRLSKVA